MTPPTREATIQRSFRGELDEYVEDGTITREEYDREVLRRERLSPTQRMMEVITLLDEHKSESVR